MDVKRIQESRTEAEAKRKKSLGWDEIMLQLHLLFSQLFHPFKPKLKLYSYISKSQNSNTFLSQALPQNPKCMLWYLHSGSWLWVHFTTFMICLWISNMFPAIMLQNIHFDLYWPYLKCSEINIFKPLQNLELFDINVVVFFRPS